MSLPEQYFSFTQPERSFLLAVLAVAAGTPVEAIAPLINRYLTPDDPVAHPYRSLPAKLMQALQIPSSPLVGKLLTAIALAHIEGKIYTRQKLCNGSIWLTRCDYLLAKKINVFHQL